MDEIRNMLILLLAAVLLGCSKQPEPRHIVILVDVSGSIDRQTLDLAFKGIDEMISRLHRGDRIAIIPILGDALAEASGRIMRFEVPPNRQAYDNDLRGFRTSLRSPLGEMEAAALAHPGTRTDILGSVLLAEQEFHVNRSESKRLLVILSDFIQEDREIDFRKDQHLVNRPSVKEFAGHFTKAHPAEFTGASIYLGSLRSREYATLSSDRRAGIQEFWIEYFRSCGGYPKFVNDGSGLLASE